MSEDGIEGGSTEGEAPEAEGRGAVGCFEGAGVKGSFVRFGYEDGSRWDESDWKVIDLTKTTWQYSGYRLVNAALGTH